MKQLLSILFFCIALGCFGQNLSYVPKTYGSGYTLKVIQPTIDNFVQLCDMNDTQFVSTMKQYGYFPTEDSGNPISYWNGSIDNFAYAGAVVNTFMYDILSEWVSYWVQKDHIYPHDSMTNFIRSLKPYYYARKNVIYDSTPSDVFKIERNGTTYGIFVTDLGKAYDVRIHTFAN